MRLASGRSMVVGFFGSRWAAGEPSGLHDGGHDVGQDGGHDGGGAVYRPWWGRQHTDLGL